ncbi:MAG TPA: hypothetical protein VNZ26_25560 [Vicinamibacterales bacterium]|jgi:hypothetical protein|nr:hypothetical protein [Vicinamibacterales bacterium]
MPVRSYVCGVLAMALGVTSVLAQGTRLLRHPTVSHGMVAFEYGRDLWVVPRTGGDARRLTSTPSLERRRLEGREHTTQVLSAT